MHTNRPALVAERRITLEDIEADQRARDVYRIVTSRAGLLKRLVSRARHRWYRFRRADNASRTLTTLAAEMTDLANEGATESDVMLFELHVAESRRRLFSGNAVRPLTEIDPEECAHESRENQLRERRACGAETPEGLREEAQACEMEATVSLEKAHALRFRAAKLEREALRGELSGIVRDVRSRFLRPMGAPPQRVG